MKLVKTFVALALLGAALVGVVAPVPASAGSWTLVQVEKDHQIPSPDDNPATAVDQSHSLLYVASSEKVSVYSTKTLQLLREYKTKLTGISGLFVDEVHTRLFVGGKIATDQPAAITVIAQDSPLPPAVVPAWQFPTQYVGASAAALTYDPRNDTLYAITRIYGEGQAAPDVQVTIHKLAAAVVAKGEALESNGLTGYKGISWSYVVDGCPAVPQSKTGGFLGLIPEGAGSLYFMCSAPPFSIVAVSNASPTTAAVVIDTATLGKTGTDVGVLRRDDSTFKIEQYPMPGILDRPFVAPAGPGRLMAATSSAGQQKVFVFDAVHRAWTGAVPLGPANVTGGVTDPWSGRTFVMQETSPLAKGEVNLIVTDASALPVPQGLALTLLDEHNLAVSESDSWLSYDTRSRRLFVPASKPRRILVFDDRIPVEPPSVADDPDVRTSDVDEEGATVSYAGEATAFGARHILVNGLGGTPAGTANLPSQLPQIPRPSEGDRGTILAWSELGRLNGSEQGSSEAAADARRLKFDDNSTTDMGLLGLPAPVTDQWAPASCSSSRDEPQSQTQPGAEVGCDLDQDIAVASADTSGAELGAMPFAIGGASSRVFVHRDAERGVVAEASSVARDVVIGGTGTGSVIIGEARTEASAVAKGRPGTAGTKFEPVLRQVAIVAPDGSTPYQCDTCDPVEVAAAINRYLAPKIQAIPPRRDESEKVAGSPGGARAVVIQDPYAYVHDKNTSNDDSATVAALQLIVYHDGISASREFIELAGVLTGTLYTVTPGAEMPPVDPGSLSVSLVDPDGKPLAGGVFELRSDAGLPPVDDAVGDVTDTTETTLPADEQSTTTTTTAGGALGRGTTTTTSSTTTTAPGNTTSRYRAAAETTTTTTVADGEDEGGSTTTTTVADDATDTTDTTIGDGLDDALVPSGTCVTTEDGTGDCTFEDLEPGAYVVSETAAPAGYTVAEDVPVTVTPGMATTVAITNSKSSATIAITLTDDQVPPNPLAGGEFVVLVDDGDGLIGDADVELGRCTTGADGACESFVDVPLGAYVVHQASAPNGLMPAADVPFVLDIPGQTAALAFINGAPPTEGAPAVADVPPPPPPSIGRANILPPPPPPPAVVTSEPIAPPAPPARSPLRRVIAAPRDMASFLARQPGEAALFAGVWSLLLAPAYLLVRRRKLNLAKEGA